MTATIDHTATTSSAEELVALAAKLGPYLKEQAPIGDANREYPADALAKLREAGLLSLFVPKRYGGHQTDLTTYLDVTIELARGDATAGWLSMIINGSAMAISSLSVPAKADIWGDGPNAAFCGTLMPSGQGTKVEGGYSVSGSFGWASGSRHADWGLLSVMLEGANGDLTPGAVLVPSSDWTIKETWFTLGMRGTGSNTLIVNDAFVPEYRAFSITDAAGADLIAEVPYTIPRGAYISLWATPVPLGIAKAALDIAREQLPKRGLAYTTYTNQADSVACQVELAEAALKIDIADALLHKAAAVADEAGHTGVELSLEQSALIKIEGTQAVKLCRQAVIDIVELCGASSMADNSPLQRLYRDISTAALHGLLRQSVASEVYGRVLLGREPEITQL